MLGPYGKLRILVLFLPCLYGPRASHLGHSKRKEKNLPYGLRIRLKYTTTQDNTILNTHTQQFVKDNSPVQPQKEQRLLQSSRLPLMFPSQCSYEMENAQCKPTCISPELSDNNYMYIERNCKNH